jgi:hypothetical protein
VSIPSKKLKRPASADERQVAKKSTIKNPGKENFFLNGRKIVLGSFDQSKILIHNIPSN